jgi:hypothetical protein
MEDISGGIAYLKRIIENNFFVKTEDKLSSQHDVQIIDMTKIKIFTGPANLLGSGTQSKVYRGTIDVGFRRNHFAAMKLIALDEESAVLALEKELRSLRMLKHHNIVELLGVTYDTDKCDAYIVLELCHLGSLEGLMSLFSDDPRIEKLKAMLTANDLKLENGI